MRGATSCLLRSTSLETDVRIYLDACCLNRPFDDSSQLRIRMEAEAVVTILEMVESGSVELLSSSVLEYELGQITDPDRRARTMRLLLLAGAYVNETDELKKYAQGLQEAFGLQELDALHVACAKESKADVFLTTDDRLLRSIKRPTQTPLSLVAENPLVWLTELKLRLSLADEQHDDR